MKHPAPPRKLHRGHIAFMRAVVQGLDPRRSWERYLQGEGEHASSHRIRQTIRWIRDEFASAARRHARHGLARLVQIDASTVEDSRHVPPLADFVHEHNLEDFSEEEQLSLYRERHPFVARSHGRRARLVARQLEALAWFEQRSVSSPLPDDPLASWLAPNLVARLEAADLHTLRALVERINRREGRWWKGIDGIGAGKAERIVAWLLDHEATTGLVLGARVWARQPGSSANQHGQADAEEQAIVPFDRLTVPNRLDGSRGSLRAPAHLCEIGASTDRDAILAWLHALRRSPGVQAPDETACRQTGEVSGARVAAEAPITLPRSHTCRAYLREAERFLLWALHERGKPLSSMTSEDCEAYKQFLADPQPAERWCGHRATPRHSPGWKPFEGPLSVSAQRHATTVLKALFNFLLEKRYIVANPWKEMAASTSRAIHPSQRSFTESQWDLLQRESRDLLPTPANARLCMALRLLQETGLRLSEASAATADDLDPASGGTAVAANGWTLRVRGTNGRIRRIPLSDALMAQIAEYLDARGLHADVRHESNAGAFLLGGAGQGGRIRRKKGAADSEAVPTQENVRHAKSGVSASVLARQLKAFFAACGACIAEHDEQAARKFASASAHWLRHTNATQSIAGGMPIPVLQRRLGHAAPSTTARYSRPAPEQPSPQDR
ncbi:phage integrase family protein [Noviherbaspirillum galbum]|uniref:Tyrosine-type recombinase/integrase n=1 Tax=Noviherbaspirillum galbum TaxID=2709383 RepID=A0A6B3SR53_9BURK|nr:phage integrase family protein [Noviherbaspirillum galbum]NEX62998.1 tyrosine-type recombinase/integrase [Noviherbaspirillum galbum]